VAAPVGVFPRVFVFVWSDHKSITLEIIRLSLPQIQIQLQIRIRIHRYTGAPRYMYKYRYRQRVLGNSLARLSLKVCPRHAVATLKCLFPIPIPNSHSKFPIHMYTIIPSKLFLPPACAYHKFICAPLCFVCVCVLLTFWVH